MGSMFDSPSCLVDLAHCPHVIIGFDLGSSITTLRVRAESSARR